MSRTLLVANRGEIACRIIDSARRLGMRTVAVHSELDRGARHVHMADDAVSIASYLDVDAVLRAAERADAVHPGYGFLSENADFARRVEAAGLAFVGPTPEQIRIFGDKHAARAAAQAAGVPVFPGTAVLSDAEGAVEQATVVGFPVILKAVGGGGGIGMAVCRTAADVREAFERVSRQAAHSFGVGGVFAERYIEHARHIEVQVFGDGAGSVVSLGDRDCSLQRRNQKVVEEAPAPNLPDDVRDLLHDSARALAASVNYRSAGTVEFVYDPHTRQASFLEVNARLQVEHPVTEAVTGIDLVAWMLHLATAEMSEFPPLDIPRHSQGGVPKASLPAETRKIKEVDLPVDNSWRAWLEAGRVPVTGHAVEARVYAEDPTADFRPSAGLITGVRMPTGHGIRVDTWIETGTDVSTAYDPLLAKVVAHAPDRDAAIDRLAAALADTRVDGIEVNLGLLRAVTANPDFRAARHSTRTLGEIRDPEPRIVVEEPGLLTTVQDVHGRLGLWQVGVPPSGAMDDRSLRLANLALGNDENAAGLECTRTGPTLRFTHATDVCVTGAPADITVNGAQIPQWTPVTVPAAGVLRVGEAELGMRTYIAFAGGLDVPHYLGSAATFTLGGFGGHGGRALRPGDVLRANQVPIADHHHRVRAAEGSAMSHHWALAVTEGPHAAPEFFTRDDMRQLFSARYEVHFNSARTGVRLVGPKPQWARPDGGEAGLHPSNIHDNAYSVGALDFTGDTPILLGPDGPSLGGFVCPVTVVSAERWKLGQLRPGDTVSFRPIRADQAPSRRGLDLPTLRAGGDGDDGVLLRLDGDPAVTYRRSGDDNVLVEYGEIVLDLALRARVHALHTALAERDLPGVIDLTPGIRSLQVHVDPDVLTIPKLLDALQEIERSLAGDLIVPSRHVRLPLSWDDPATREAIARYMAGVRDDAPWCPWNIEFIRRVNGLAGVDDVYRTVFDAEYLVLGLGDVYLGAPVATPLDPRHRLVTTKYNPARTWTAENSVGIGGAYLCVYGMEGPGGYQLVGRTTQVWSRHRSTPWLLRFFDRITWYPVEPEELLDLRADLAAGRGELDVTEGTFSLAEHQEFLAANADSIAAFRAKQSAAFEAERAAWAAAGEFDRVVEPAVVAAAEVEIPDGGRRVDAPFAASVWKVAVEPGDVVEAGQPLVVLEAMKMETVVAAPVGGRVLAVAVASAAQVTPGDLLAVLAPH